MLCLHSLLAPMLSKQFSPSVQLLLKPYVRNSSIDDDLVCLVVHLESSRNYRVITDTCSKTFDQSYKEKWPGLTDLTWPTKMPGTDRQLTITTDNQQEIAKDKNRLRLIKVCSIEINIKWKSYFTHTGPPEATTFYSYKWTI